MQPNSLTPELPEDELAMRICTHYTAPADGVPEPGHANGHVGFSAGNVHCQGAAEGERRGGAQ